MIGRITGELVESSFTEALVDVNGVGYVVFIPISTFDALPAIGKKVSLHTWLSVREDALDLYAFATPEEKELFLLLRTVSGVGPKVALAVLSSMSAQNIRAAVVSGDVAALTSIKGLGKKTVERIILELKGKLEKLYPNATSLDASGGGDSQTISDAILALMGLGRTRDAAEKAVRNVVSQLPEGAKPSVEELIKTALGTTSK